MTNGPFKIKLKIDEEFRTLIHPLSEQEYFQLEANILSDGCRTPITTWKGYIIDGHNRYKICTDHGIPFQIEPMLFSCREDVISWICANQLGRRNLTEEERKYLIGRQYEAEKASKTQRNRMGKNQYTAQDQFPPDSQSNAPWTSTRIAQANHVSHSTVEKYAIYTRALQEIRKNAPTLVDKILSGDYKISHESVVELSKKSPDDIRRINHRLESNGEPYTRYQTTRKEIQGDRKQKQNEDSRPSVKDMPAFDPDAEITALSLTVPSWTSSIQRICGSNQLVIASDKAKNRLQYVLENHQQAIAEMLHGIKEEVNG